MSWSREFAHEGETLSVSCRRTEGGRHAVQVGDARLEVEAQRMADGRIAMTIDGKRRMVAAVRSADGRGIHVRVDGRSWLLPFYERGRTGADVVASGDVTAPMTGTVLEVAVVVGQAVTAGDVVAIVTAMKMEHKLIAQIDGEVVEVKAAAGENVDEGALIVRIE